MFQKILIANRAEIACRVIRTARRLGVGTVAVYSEADVNALHVQRADEAVCIGAAPSAQSYLNADAIIAACRASGAGAVHPGYGFLSENADFAEALAAAGIVFIGPPPAAIRAMGDKINSRKLAAAAGVNVIPGDDTVIRDADHAAQVAAAIGYPVMIKASAGGGGKGMRVARDEGECRDGFERASGEARSAFGDDRVLIEKCIAEPRHVEIQILADNHGNVVHLGERECSIQRRHQKVMEEAPSPLLDDAARAAMGAQAVALARAVDYRSAGTVEFVMDAARNFYFLEMNTRLQVEHPVTEMVHRLDLVEEMMRIAAGEKLSVAQDAVKASGWAMEARIYAEDPARNFLPSSGRITRCLMPEESESVRVDSGVAEGGEVPVYYDPLIAKLIVHGADRAEAAAGLARALARFYLDGVSHNIAFLQAVARHPRFTGGELSTAFIDEEFGGVYDPASGDDGRAAHRIAAAAVMHRVYQDRAARISGQAPGREREVDGRWAALSGGVQRAVAVNPAGGHGGEGFEVEVDAEAFTVLHSWRPGAPLFEALINGERAVMQVRRDGLHYHVLGGGCTADIMILPLCAAEYLAHMPAKAAHASLKSLKSPMPGLLLRFSVAPGQAVKAGEEIAVVEAMKMENVLRAERDAVVEKILVAPGDTLAADQPLLEFAD